MKKFSQRQFSGSLQTNKLDSEHFWLEVGEPKWLAAPAVQRRRHATLAFAEPLREDSQNRAA